MSSHYSHNKTQRKYLASDLKIPLMYSLYETDCTEKNAQKTSPSIYRNVFCQEYNLGFYHPRKKQCRIYMAYNTPGNDHNAMEAE